MLLLSSFFQHIQVNAVGVGVFSLWLNCKINGLSIKRPESLTQPKQKMRLGHFCVYLCVCLLAILKKILQTRFFS